ncbi:MAG: hypothetical protein JWN30_1332 [Bacilli bacterium]|nr:hypothetical protein [Bacilli bacterium]
MDNVLNEDKWARRTAIFTTPPQRIPTHTFVDAPLLGNGDVGIAIGGDAEHQTFHIGKNDFWVQAHVGETEEQRRERLLNDNGRRTGARIITVGQVALRIPALADAAYKQEQDLLHAEVRGSFQKEGLTVELCSWMNAVQNVLITEISCNQELDVVATLHAGEMSTSEVFNYENGIEPDLMWFQYAANSANVPDTRRVAVASHVLGCEVTYDWRYQNVTAALKLSPGRKAYLVTTIISDLDNPDYLSAAKRLANRPALQDILQLKTQHRHWWQNFWSESYIEIDDPVLDQFYYGSHYVIASCMRNGKVSPGLFGNWVTTDRPAWTGSYTINYNYQAPYWGLYAGNHLSLAEAYCEPLLAAIPFGKLFAKEFLDCRGIYLPVELGPWGLICCRVFHEQRSNAAFGAVNLLMHYYHTYDREYAQKIYPFLLETAEFWEDYLRYEDGQYVIYDDSIHERSNDRKNPILSLGLIKMVLKGLLEISQELELNVERFEKWQHILDHLSPYPLMSKNGKTVFRLTEEGRDWNDRNSLAVQHVFPAGMIGLQSDPEMLQIAWDTVDQMQRWSDHNAFPTYYTAAARVGYDPQTILDKLRQECLDKAFPNLVTYHGGGGIEDCSTVPSCLHEMLLQSHEGVLRLFPVWPQERPAKFGRLRAVGAFLVSSELQAGEVQSVMIESERGRVCHIVNPWPDHTVVIYRNGTRAEERTGERFVFPTTEQEQILLLKK